MKMNRKEKVNERSAGFVDKDLKTDEHDAIMLWLNENIHSIFQEKGDYTVGEVTWEMPITRGDRNYRTIVGYIDLYVRAYKKDEGGYDKSYRFAFEVKSSISNVGEVIRQIRQYQVHSQAVNQFVIVCPDDKFADVIRSQGIGFLKAPQPQFNVGENKMTQEDYDLMRFGF